MYDHPHPTSLNLSERLTSTKWSKVHILSLIAAPLESVERGEWPYKLFHGRCDENHMCYLYVAGLGVELATLGSAVDSVDCGREPGLQKCGLFLRPLAKIWMYIQNVYIAAEAPNIESECECESRGCLFETVPTTYLSLGLIMRIFFTDRKRQLSVSCESMCTKDWLTD